MTEIRTLFVCQWYPPEPASVPASIAAELHRQGHLVEVLTGIPNYPTGTVLAGYRAWKPRRETIQNLNVLRTPLFPSHDASPTKRMLNYVSWALTSAALGARRIRQADLALVYSSPATAALAPAMWRRATKTPYVLLLQDLWPDSVMSSGMMRRGLVARVVGWGLTRFVGWTYRGASKVVVTSPGMVDLLVSRGVSRKKIELIFNWAPVESMDGLEVSSPDARIALGLDPSALVVTYAGNLGLAQGLEAVVEAARLLKNERDVVIVIAGDGVATDRLMAQAEGLGNIRFLGRLPSSDMSALQAASDVQLVSLVDDPLFAVTMPSKIQSILAAGNPLIVMAPGDAASVAVESGAGWAVEPGDGAGLAKTILNARAAGPEGRHSMGQRGRTYYSATMSKTIGSVRLDRVLREAALVAAPKRRRPHT